jgi:hypothetical protein
VRTGIGFLIATCHTDVLQDLAPDVHLNCGYGSVHVSNAPEASDKGRHRSDVIAKFRKGLPSGLSFAHELSVAVGSLADWPPFARWHYRSHHVGSVRFVAVLRHLEEPIGICIFTTPPLSLAGRNRFFGRSGKWTRLSISSLNRQLATLSRVVLHPTYRGAGLAAAFVRRSCQMCPSPWIESLAQMGHVNPFFEKAGFVRVDVPTRKRRARSAESTLYGAPSRRAAGKHRKLPIESRKTVTTNVADPVYYVFDNRTSARGVKHDANGSCNALSRKATG